MADALPQAIPDAIAPEQSDGKAGVRAELFIATLRKKRDEAIQGRRNQGIEVEWLEDEEYYQGVDDANRAFVRPTSSSVVSEAKGSAPARQESEGGRSILFLNITRPYVDAAASRVADMLLPVDDRSWAIKPTPVPELSPETATLLGHPTPEAAQVSQTEQAAEAAEAMQDAIDDLLVESNWHAEVRKVIEDCARIGTGVIKGPYPHREETKVYKQVAGVPQFSSVVEIKPGSRHILPWNLFPDPSCGESIHDGSFVWERDYLTKKKLLDLAALPGFDQTELLAALAEGPKNVSTRDAGATVPVPTSQQWEMWTFYGLVDAEDLRAMGEDVPDETVQTGAMCVMINDRVVKATLNVMETQEFPYDLLAWERKIGMPWGTGVARHVRTPQRMLNGAARAMMDNAALSAAPQIVIGNGITPVDGKYAITGRKVWRAESDVVDVRAAFTSFSVETRQPELMAIVNWALDMAERVTGIPQLLQGQQGEASETLGGMQMLMNKATGMMRRIAKRFDDWLTEPHIRRYYNWLMQHSDDPKIKGDFQIDVRGSSALVERDAQQQWIMGAMQLSANPVYGVDPSKLFAEWAKGVRLDPQRFQYPPDVIAQMRQGSNPVDDAKAKLLEAQAGKAKAETANTTAQTLFSSVNITEQLAANPMLAAAADKVAVAAGVQDQTPLPQLTPQPLSKPTPGFTIPANTHPDFPAQPQAADAGAEAGIEGGQ